MSEVSPRRAQLRDVGELFRREARDYATKVSALVELTREFGSDRDGLVMELAGTARMGQDRTAGELDRAVRLAEHYPRALVLLGRGEMLVATVDILLRLTKKCSPQVQDELGRRLPDRIAALDAADARPLIAETVLQVEAELELAAQQERHAKARANRGVWVMPVEDGMARIGAEVDSLRARHFGLDLDELVRAEKARDLRDGISRTQSQRRADVLAELPARHLALLQALARGQADQLLAEALTRNEARAEGAPSRPPRVEELPLGLPPAERPTAWALGADELAIELLRQPVRAPVTLNVHVPMSTLLDLDTRPAVVEGLGYVPGWLARTLLPDAALRRVAVNAATGLPLHLDAAPRHGRGHPPDAPPGPGRRRPPPPQGPPGSDGEHPEGSGPVEQCCSGDPVDLGTADDGIAGRKQAQLLAMLQPVQLRDTTEAQHDPSAGLRRLVQVRDLRCTGPGCPRSATSCDLDHELEYGKGGPTSEPNLSAKSPRCHRAKHAGWTAVRDVTTGVTAWTSPDGSTYTRQPAWRRHPWHPEVVHPPLPRLEQLPDAESDYPFDRPLWIPPPLPETPKPKAKTTPPVEPVRSRGWYDGGPPPF